MAMEEKLKNIDRSNIKKVILDFPKQFKIGLKAAEKIKTKKIPVIFLFWEWADLLFLEKF